VVIPKSVTPSRIAENFNVWDRLDKDELSEITKLDQNKRLGRPGSVRRLTFPAPSASGGASLCYLAKTRTFRFIAIKWMRADELYFLPNC
jgi:ABC-type sulfate transport system substrate-binding protein